MTNLITRLLIRNYQNVEDPKVRSAYGKVAGLTGIVTNLLLTVAKLAVGLLSGSIAIVADGVNNLTDSASSVVTMVGFKLASKPADEKHPYGYARIEYISGLIVSIIILVLGVELGRSSFDKIIHPEEVSINAVVLCILAGSILLKLWQYFFYRKMGRAIHSTTLKATATDSLNDVITTSVVLVGSIISYFIGFNLDGYLGMAVAAFIVFSGVQLVKETSSPLLGLAPSKEIVAKMCERFHNCKELIGFHDLQLHDYGEQRYFATVHVEMDSTMSLETSHHIIDELERQVREELGVELVVHLDPVSVDDKRTRALQGRILSFLHSISPELSIHDFQVKWEEKPILSFDMMVPYRFSVSDEELRRRIEAFMDTMDEDYVLQLDIDHGDALGYPTEGV